MTLHPIILSPSEKILRTFISDQVHLCEYHQPKTPLFSDFSFEEEATIGEEPQSGSVIPYSFLQYYRQTFAKPAPYENCLIYVTTERLVVVPIISTQYAPQKSFAIRCNPKKTEAVRCFYEKDISYPYNKTPKVMEYRVCLMLDVQSKHTIELDVCYKSKTLANCFADLVNFVIYSRTVSSFLPTAAEHVEPMPQKKLVEFQVHEEIFFGHGKEGEECGQSEHNMGDCYHYNEFEDSDDSLISYRESEIATGNLFKSIGLLEQVRPKIELNLDTEEDLYTGSQASDKFVKLVLIRKSNFEDLLGNYKFKFLANHCLKYIQRNLSNGIRIIDDCPPMSQDINEHDPAVLPIYSPKEDHGADQPSQDEQVAIKMERIKEIESSIMDYMGARPPSYQSHSKRKEPSLKKLTTKVFKN